MNQKVYIKKVYIIKMTFEILMPEINNNPKNTKDCVISILTYEWPLTLRKIFYKIKKQYHYSSTYQAVYKAVKELKEKNVLIEKEKGFEINISWIKKVQSFTDIVETNYYTKQKFHDFNGIKESKTKEDLIVLNFDTIFDAEKYLYYFMKNELINKRNDNICFSLNSEWRPIFYLRAEYNYYKKLTNKGHKFYFICSGETELEREFRDFYKRIKVNYKILKFDQTNDLLVFQDYFIQIFIPEELKNKMKECLKKRDTMRLLTEVLEKKSDIKIIINKDEGLAKETKKNIINKF
jgi:hypothetical protein